MKKYLLSTALMAAIATAAGAHTIDGIVKDQKDRKSVV